MMTEKDNEQDALIRLNAENIRANAEAIRRQTAALEKIRDHYFPKKTPWKRITTFFLKVVGAATVAAGLMEAGEWYWNTRKADAMAAQSAQVARRLFFRENDAAGAARFLEKAVELDGGTVRYRILLTYVKGMSAIGDLFDLGRPLTSDERTRVDGILTEAVYLQEMAPDDPMPYVLAAQAYGLRGEREAAVRAAERAVGLAPDNVQAHVTACVMQLQAGNRPMARQRLAEAARLDPAFPLVRQLKAFFAWTVDRDAATALKELDSLLAHAPRLALAHILRGRILASGPSPDRAAARAAFARALVYEPQRTQAMCAAAETYEAEGNLEMARLWLDRAVSLDARDVKSLVARARIRGKAGDWADAAVDLTAALALDPFRADLYRARAKAYAAAGKAAEAQADGKAAAALDKVRPK